MSHWHYLRLVLMAVILMLRFFGVDPVGVVSSELRSISESSSESLLDTASESDETTSSLKPGSRTSSTSELESSLESDETAYCLVGFTFFATGFARDTKPLSESGMQRCFLGVDLFDTGFDVDLDTLFTGISTSSLQIESESFDLEAIVDEIATRLLGVDLFDK